MNNVELENQTRLICNRCKVAETAFTTRNRRKTKCAACIEAMGTQCPRCMKNPRALSNTNRKHIYCRECLNQWGNENYRRPHVKKRIAKKNKEMKVTAPKTMMLRGALARARKKEVPFNLSEDDFEISTHCPVLGIKFELGTQKNHDFAPSLDRIVPALGYVKGNVRVISWKANNIRGKASAEQLEKDAGNLYVPGKRTVRGTLRSRTYSTPVEILKVAAYVRSLQ